MGLRTGFESLGRTELDIVQRLKYRVSWRFPPQFLPQAAPPVMRIFNRIPISVIALFACFAILVDANLARSQNDEKTEFFESKIRPLLVDHCYECHSQSTRQEGGLTLDSRDATLQGGDRGASLVPSKPYESLIITAVRWNDPDLQMPPKDSGGKLSAQQISYLEQWISEGAFDPRTESSLPSKKTWDEKFKERLDWWSLQPLRTYEVPSAIDSQWNRTSIDRFLYQAMDQKGIGPSGIATARTLVRRATLILTGLPPSEQAIESFVKLYERSPDEAYSQLIDGLLAQPAFGERFTKHWLDVVRFTETHGNEWNYDVPYAYRYRDYMIRAINDDLPYDQWIREHVAGDLFKEPRRNPNYGFNESIIGTAFYRFGEVNHDSCTQFAAIGYDIADNQVDTLSKVFQATTVSCARCHDHKMDAVSTKDYHSMLGIIRSSRSVQHTLDPEDLNRKPLQKLEELKIALQPKLSELWKQSIAEIDASAFQRIIDGLKEKKLPLSDRLTPWMKMQDAWETPEAASKAWGELVAQMKQEEAEVQEWNSTKYETLYDFREGIPKDWTVDGLGLRSSFTGPSYQVAHEGDAVLSRIIPRGVFTSLLSDKMNGAIRSPTLKLKKGKVSLEVIGGGFSLSRIVYNNCQLNYTNQHSIHHPDWTWITLDVPENSEPLTPYLELLTYWDNPKFPDPLGTLSKDTENQRLPYSDHSKNPRTWYGIRRIVAHQEPLPPKPEIAHLIQLIEGETPKNDVELLERYRKIANDAIDSFEQKSASDDQLLWLDWFLCHGLLPNSIEAVPSVKQLVEEYRNTEIHQLALPMTMPGVADENDGFDQPVLARGDFTKPGEIVARQFLKALEPEGKSIVLSGSGRAMLAEQIASRSNPLTSRVFVNRVWQWVFGQGLVRTPDDFGHLGDVPIHLELLDHLALDFMESGWSMKKLVRQMMLSRAFMGSNVPTPEARELDPLNRYLSYSSPRRAEAEVIRDSVLWVSGRLDATMYGPSIHPFREKADTEKRLYVGPLDGDGRRSIYLKFQLMEQPRFLSAFNLPGGKVVQGKRDTSNVPAQSLAMLNDPFVWKMSEYWARSEIAKGNESIEQRLGRMFERALGRSPTTDELSRFVSTAKRIAELQNISEGDRMTSELLWRDLAHAIFNMKEFIYVP